MLLLSRGSPEGNIVSRPGELARDVNSGDLYVKKTGIGNTGWKRLARAEEVTGGGGGSTPYVHTQGVASATWTITHGLGYFPNVTIVDSSGNVVEGDVHYDSNNQVTATFSAPFSGNAYLS